MIELLIGTVIAAVILAAGVQFIGVAIREFRVVSKEYAVQNGVRSSMDNIEDIVKESTTLFTVDKNSFDHKMLDRMKSGWNYIGLSPDETKLVNYVWVWKDKKKKNGFHKAIDITPTEWNIKDEGKKEVKYQVQFYHEEDGQPMKPEDIETMRKDQKMLRIRLVGQLEGTESRFDLNRKIVATNTTQVLDSRKDKTRENPVTALAYRTDNPILGGSEAAVVFVIDMSSSMTKTLKGEATTVTDDKRLTILKKMASEFVKKLENAGKVDLYFVPFTSYTYGCIEKETNSLVEIEKEYFKQYDYALQKYINASKKITDSDQTAIKENSRKDTEAIVKALEDLYYNKDSSGKYIKKDAAGKSVYRRSWSDPKIKKKVDDLFKDIENKLAVLKTNEENTSFGEVEAQQSAEAARDAIRDCMELLQQPYHLDKDKPQADLAIDYIYNNLKTREYGLGAPFGTNLGAGIREGYRLLKRSDKKIKYLVVLSDGKPEQFDSAYEMVRYPRTHKKPPAPPSESDQPSEMSGHIKNYRFLKKADGKIKKDDNGKFIKLDDVEIMDKRGNLVRGHSAPYTGLEGAPILIKYDPLRHEGKGYQRYTDDRFEGMDPEVLYSLYVNNRAEYNKLEAAGLYYCPDSSPGIPAVQERTENMYYPPSPSKDIAIDPKNPDDPRVLLRFQREYLWFGSDDLKEIATSTNLHPVKYAKAVMTREYNDDLTDYLIDKTFFIGFSSLADEKKHMIEMLETSDKGGCSRVSELYDTDSEVNLGVAFGKISGDIEDGLWFFDGP